jgi:hypothetical protein
VPSPSHQERDLDALLGGDAARALWRNRSL